MKYKVIKGCVIKGESCHPGAVVDLDKDLARDLMGIGRVMPHDESKPVNRAVGLESSEEAPAKRRGRTKAKKEEAPAEPESAPEEAPAE
jgi:hypothetical protein